MAKLSIGDKARRVLDFMLGIRNRRVRRALAAHGFTEEDLAQGWALLTALTDNKLDFEPTVIDPRLVAELDAWENRWFPIAQASLRTNHPKVYAFVFRNLSQTEGAEVVVSVATLLDRIEAMVKPASDGGLGADGKAARKLLEKRGLDAKAIAEARALITQIGSLEKAPEEPEPAEVSDDAEEKLWNWYLEWSSIARVAIRDRRMLRSLGFLRVVRGAGGAEEEEVVTHDDLVTEPTEVVTPTPVEPTDVDPTPT